MHANRARGYPASVDDAGNPRFIAAHVRDVARRTEAETDGLAGLILRWAWPTGHDDRFDPIAVGWLRQWRVNTISPAPASCSCLEGRCAVCN
jgi:hypothetical protein